MGNNAINADNLKNYKDEILKAEIGALLFNLGKTHIGFWRKKKDKDGKEIIYFPVNDTIFAQQFGYKPFSSYKSYYQKDNSLEKSPFEYELEKIDPKLKDFVFCKTVRFPFEVENGKREINWSSFFKVNSLNEGEEGKKFIEKIFFRGCENINSGIDKGSPNKQMQSLWISNAFGSFREHVKDYNFDNSRLCFFVNLHRFLGGHNYYDNPDWIKIRDWILDKIKSWYSRLLSDSRFPVNDVTLFDQAYMTASMFKAALSSLFLNNEKYEKGKSRLDKYMENPQSIKWSILGIQYDKLGLAEKGLKPGFISWYRNVSQEVDNDIKRLLETEYPIGNEVYRDETGIYFIVGENLKGNKSGNFYKLSDDLKEIKEKILEIFTQHFEGEIYPAIFLTKPSRGLMNLGHLIEKAKENFLEVEKLPEKIELEKIEITDEQGDKKEYYVNPDRNFLDEENKEPNYAIGICPVCKHRLVFKIDTLNNKKGIPICEECKGRQENRLNDWIKNSKNETIWTGELQDKNGRIALIALKFEMKEWLNGTLVNELLVQKPLNTDNYSTIKQELTNDLKNQNGRNKRLSQTILKNYKGDIKDRNLDELVRNLLLERSIGSKWEELICKKLNDWNERKSNCNTPGKKIDFDNRKIYWNELDNSDIKFLSQIILQFLLRKNPSPARLKRIWDTTREFFEDIHSEILNILEIPEQRQKRLVWHNINLDNGEYKDGEFEFWVKDKTAYLITSIEKIENKSSFSLKKHENNENANENLEISNAEKINYKPILLIITPTPVSWQFAIPADRVPVLLKKIKERYNENFRWVYGKLPLHIGIVVQNYKKPLYVGIKALRNIRRDCTEWRHLRKKLPGKDLKARQKEAFYYSAQPEKIADCESYYSLYEKTEGEGRYEFYLYTADKRKQWLDTTQNAADTDKFTIYPNTFDFEFLDTNTRRNDIYYRKDKAKRFLKIKQNRPYNLSDWQYFEKFKEYFSDKKSSSRLQKLVSLVYSKLEDWKGDNESIKTFILTAFVNILELKNREQKDDFSGILKCNNWDELKNSNANGFIEKLYMILDMFEFYHTALKEV